jgi:HEAT repeat protein
MVLDQIAALGSSDISVRLDAVVELAEQPDVARPALVAALMDPSTSALTCIWSMIALALLEHGEDQTVARALVHCLRHSEAIVRRCAVDMLGSLKVAWAVPDIGSLLSDHEPIDSAWFDDDATPSRAAIRALELIDSPEAKVLLEAFRRT